MNETLEVKYSNKKQLIFIALGVFLMILGSLHFLNIPFFKVGHSYIFLGIGFVLAVSLFFNMKQQNGKVGLIFNENRLIYNPEKQLFVEWKAIDSYSEYNLNSTRYVLVHLKDAETFIAKQRDLSMQKKMKLAHKTFNTPVVLNSQFLDISTEELKEELHKRLHNI